MTRRFRLSNQAEADLDEIGLYTKDNWGAGQAEKYLTQLDQTFHVLAQTPSLGQDCSDLRPGLLSITCNRHIIFFRRNAAGTVEILRILHQRMDFQRHL